MNKWSSLFEQMPHEREVLAKFENCPPGGEVGTERNTPGVHKINKWLQAGLQLPVFSKFHIS